MTFKIDENLPAEIKDDLRAAGRDAETVVDEGLAGAPDPQLVLVIQREKRVLPTMDKGIGDVRKYPPDQYAGIVLFVQLLKAAVPHWPLYDAIYRRFCRPL